MDKEMKVSTFAVGLVEGLYDLSEGPLWKVCEGLSQVINKADGPIEEFDIIRDVAKNYDEVTFTPCEDDDYYCWVSGKNGVERRIVWPFREDE